MSEHTLPENPRDWPKDPRRLLGLGGYFDRSALRRAYTRLIRVYKPEHAPAEFALIRAAYERLEQELAWRSAFQREEEGEDDESPDRPRSSATDDAVTGNVVTGDIVTGDVADKDLADEDSADEDSEIVGLHRARDAADTGPSENSGRKRGQEREADPWDVALAGDWDAAYGALRSRIRRGTADSEIYCQIYWLLKLQPTHDTSRRAAAWLVAGLVRHTHSPELQELYCEELRSRPAEVLETGADALLESGPLHWLHRLASERWKAAGELNRYELIGNDVERLKRRFADERPAWLHLQVAAVEQLCRSDGPTATQLMEACRREINSLDDLQLRFSSAFDRYELLLDYSVALRVGVEPPDSDDFLRKWNPENRRRPVYSNALNRLLPDLFLRSNEELYEPLLLVLECWMANPGDGLNELDELERRNHSAVLRIYELVTTLLSTTGNVPTPPEAGRLLDFLDLNPVRSYGELRTGLRTFCLDEGTTLPCVAELVAQRPEYDEFHAQRLSELMNADVPLQTLLLGIYTFWQA